MSGRTRPRQVDRSATMVARHAAPTLSIAAAVLVWVALTALGALPAAAQTTTTAGPATSTTVAGGTPAPIWTTRVEGAITPPMADYLVRTIESAEAEGAAALIIEMDTPGGLDSSMRSIIQAEIDAGIAVVIYVFPQGARAASAGVYIMMGSDVAAMAPQTNLGSAHPVSLTGDMDETMEAKVTNDAAAYMRGLATTHGRNATWGEQAVRESVSMTAEEAEAAGVVEFVAEDLDDLLDQMDGYTTVPKGLTLRTAGAPVAEVSMSWRDRFLHTIVNPNIVFILLLLGIYGLIFEFQSPGLGVAGVAGAISLLLAVYAMQLLPVSYVGLALLAVAVVLYIAETQVQSHGALALAGTVALVLGGLLLFDAPGSFVRVDWVVIAGVAVLSLSFFLVAVTAVSRARRRPATTGLQGMIGETAVVRRLLDPDGQVAVHGELWRAHSIEGPVAAGREVEVVAVDGLALSVRPRAETAADVPDAAGTDPSARDPSSPDSAGSQPT